VDANLLSRLSRALGPSGFEERVRAVIAEELARMGYEARSDELGNLYVTLGSGRPLLVLAAHMDEVGFLVRHVEDSGFLRVVALGGVNAAAAQGHQVVVMGERGDVPGIVGAAPPHLREAQPRELTVEDLYVDVGASSAEEAARAGIGVGSPVAFAPSFSDWGEHVAGKALDDRVGCYALLEALRGCSGPEKGTVVVAFTVQEEVGLRGAAALAHELKPDYAIAVEGTIANDTPGTPPDRVVTRVGRGPAIRVMDRTIIASQKLLKHVKELAERLGVPHQLQLSPYSGTDAGGFAQVGAAATAVSVPVRYIHAPVSLAKKSDVEHAVSLLRAVIENPWPQP
jgi:endoglucanase